MKNAEEYLLEIITKKISKDEVLKLYNDLIKPDVNALKHEEGKNKNKRKNILNTLNNIESIRYKDAPKNRVWKDYCWESKIKKTKIGWS